MICPFRFLRKISEGLGLNRKPTSITRKTSQSNASRDFLDSWRAFVNNAFHVTKKEDHQFAERLMLEQVIQKADYSLLEEKYPDGVISAKKYVIEQLASLIYFCRVTGDEEALRFSGNICFSFYEILAVLQIIVKDFSEDFRIEPRFIRYARKLVLNNASHHNSLGGGMLHLYLKYSTETGFPVFARGSELKHTEEFTAYAMSKLSGYVDELGKIISYTPEEADYQLMLLNFLTRGDTSEEDVQAIEHFVVNFLHGKERVGCPFLKSKHLINFVDSILKPFGCVAT